MTIIEEQQAKYLIKSLQHHPSPYLIFCTDRGVEWMNKSAQYVFDTPLIDDIKIAPIVSFGASKKIEAIGSSFQSDLELELREIKFLLRSRVHEIPLDKDESCFFFLFFCEKVFAFFLIEVLAQSEMALDALKNTISCLENDRIDMAYQKQYDLASGELVSVETLLRLRDEKGDIIPNDKLIPLVEGESLFSLVVLASMQKLKEIFKFKKENNLDFTVYLNVSAYTAMQENFCKIILDFVKENNLNPGDLGLEITETAELEDITKAAEYFENLKSHGIPLALDDFGAGYSSLSYLRDLPIKMVKLDKDFSRTVSEQDTQELVKFVVSICENMELDMLAEGIETQEQQETFLKLGCDKGQGYFHHRPQFLEEFKEEF
jgi:EAL domain-containing protein (putative c-di-GMP-specific phosphodiesterase class I)